MAFTPPEVVVNFHPSAARYADGLIVESTIGGRNEYTARAQVVVSVNPSFGFRFSRGMSFSPDPSDSTENVISDANHTLILHYNCGSVYEGQSSYRQCPGIVTVDVYCQYQSNGKIIRWSDTGNNAGKIMTSANSDMILYR